MKFITVQKLSERIKSEEIFILDVRNPDEFAFSNIGGLNIPLPQIHDCLDQINKDKTIYCLCHHGIRSQMAQDFLSQQGYSDVVNIDGGIDAWSLEIDSNIPRY
jgi:rhodanese-related sulfurtransferase